MATWDQQPPRLTPEGWNRAVPLPEIKYRIDGVDWKFKNLDDAVKIAIELQNRRLGGPEDEPRPGIDVADAVIDAEYRDATDTLRLPEGGDTHA